MSDGIRVLARPCSPRLAPPNRTFPVHLPLRRQARLLPPLLFPQPPPQCWAIVPDLIEQIRSCRYNFQGRIPKNTRSRPSTAPQRQQLQLTSVGYPVFLPARACSSDSDCGRSCTETSWETCCGPPRQEGRSRCLALLTVTVARPSRGLPRHGALRNRARRSGLKSGHSILVSGHRARSARTNTISPISFSGVLIVRGDNPALLETRCQFPAPGTHPL